MSDNVGDLISGCSPEEVVDSKAHEVNMVGLNGCVKSDNPKTSIKSTQV
jgi:hypothetical protein